MILKLAQSLPTLTDHTSIVTEATVVAVNGGAVGATEQVCFRTSTPDTTHSGRLGGVTKQTTGYRHSTCVHVRELQFILSEVCTCFNTPLTIRGEPQLSADHGGILIVPGVTTHSAIGPHPCTPLLFPLLAGL